MKNAKKLYKEIYDGATCFCWGDLCEKSCTAHFSRAIAILERMDIPEYGRIRGYILNGMDYFRYYKGKANEREIALDCFRKALWLVDEIRFR